MKDKKYLIAFYIFLGIIAVALIGTFIENKIAKNNGTPIEIEIVKVSEPSINSGNQDDPHDAYIYYYTGKIIWIEKSNTDSSINLDKEIVIQDFADYVGDVKYNVGDIVKGRYYKNKFYPDKK